MGAKRFQDLIVWQKSHRLTLEVCRLVRGFPDEERYALSPQMRRAAMSIPANLAEGFASLTEKRRAWHYGIAWSSAEELRNFLILAKDLGYLDDPSALEAALDEIGAMLYTLLRRILSA